MERGNETVLAASAAWHTFRRMRTYKSEREGAYFVAVEPEGTTNKCASYGVETGKPLWVRRDPRMGCRRYCQ